MLLENPDKVEAFHEQGIAVRRTTDTLIATFCIDERRPLLYTDKDFEPFVDYLGLRRAVA